MEVLFWAATDENGDATTRRIELTVADGPEFVSLDVDGDGNINTAEAFDASGADIAYFDDVAIANNALITDFGAGDSITVDGDVDDYSFSNFGGDIVITSNVDGVVSEITIDADVADFVFDEATAEAALGFDQYAREHGVVHDRSLVGTRFAPLASRRDPKAHRAGVPPP